jgi:hypothetical protein
VALGEGVDRAVDRQGDRGNPAKGFAQGEAMTRWEYTTRILEEEDGCLAESGGVVSRAARLARMDRSAFRRLMRKARQEET